jgi:hypothetical protein
VLKQNISVKYVSYPTRPNPQFLGIAGVRAKLYVTTLVIGVVVLKGISCDTRVVTPA